MESFDGVDGSAPLPIDFPGPILSLIKRIRPTLLLIARTDVWPELLYQCKRKNIPSILFSATFSNMRGYERLFLPFWRWRYRYLSAIACVSEADQKNLKARGVRVPSFVSGDTRMDQVIERLRHPKPLNSQFRPSAEVKTLIMGSSWKEDEATVLPGVRDFVNQGDLNLIIVPHEPTPSHLSQLESRLTSLGIKHQRYSTATSFQSKVALVMDRVGFLAELYQWADFAYVGGSFGRGVHSVLEPLGAGCVTLVGPKHKNSREALQFKARPIDTTLFMVNVVCEPQDVRQVIELCLKRTDLNDFRHRIRSEIELNAGATQRLLRQLNSYAIP